MSLSEETLTIDQFLDEMEKIYGVEGIGYMKVLEKAKEMKKEKEILKKENAELEEANAELEEANVELRRENAELEEANMELGEESEEIEKENVKLKNKISKITSILTKPSNIGYVQKIKNVLEVIGNDEEVKDGKPTFRQLYENQNMEFEGQKNKISYLEKEIEKLKKISNVKTDLIENLFSKIVKKADIDDGISISKEYGHKYIDEWNKMYEDLIKDTIKVMNEHELDYGLYLEFHDCNCIEFCVMNSDSDSEEDGDSD
tara:strand:+ start:29 stop:808 length:780 start_codon:yes stop_codon:yes gene_type:complete